LKSAISASVEEYKEEKKAAVEKSISNIPVIGNIFKAYKNNKKPKKDSKQVDELSDSSDNKMELLKKNNVILTQISDNVYNIAGRMGAELSSMKDVEKALAEQDKQAEPVPQGTQPDATKAVEPKGKKISTKTKAAGLGILGLVGVALMFGKDIIEGMVNFFKNPFEIISSLLGSLGEGIVEWFQEGGFKDFIIDAFEEGKKELVKTFEDLKDIFKILIGDPVANLIDDIKLYFIGITVDGLKMLPDWLKGDSVNSLLKNLEKSKSNIEEGKETRSKETQAAKDNIKKRNEKPAEGGQEPPKQTAEDLKQEPPQQEPVATPPSPAPAPTPSVTTSTGAAVTTESGATLKTGAQETEEAAAKPIPTTTDKTPPPAPAAAPVSKPTVSGKQEAPKGGVIDIIKSAMESLGITNVFAKAALLANIQKESGFKPTSENLDAYSKTSNERIRKIFTTRVSNLSDDELTNIKKDPVAFGDLIYGMNTKLGQGMGNTKPGDGYKYRGRGFIQITGKNNYAYYGKIVGEDLISDPDKANDPFVAAKIAAAFVLKGLKNKINSFSSIGEANRAVTQTIGGSALNLDAGYGAEILSKVGNYAGQFINEASPTVAAAKRDQPGQTVINVNNSVATAVKVGAPQGSSTTVARPVGTA